MKDRILSIDVMRGMIIFLMIVVNTPGSWKYVYPDLLHAKWHGCTLTDIVFPGFLFVIGLTMSISFRKFDERSRALFIKKIITRSVLIFTLGLLLNWFPFFHKHISDLRIFGVLQRIALSFFLASMLLVISKKWKFLAIVSTALMMGHWALLYHFGMPEPYSLDFNMTSDVDLWLIGDSHMYHGFGPAFDPEGIVGVLTGAAQVLLGYIIGYQVTSQDVDNDTITFLIIVGPALIALGLWWDTVLPINKPLWTGSYVIYTTGILSLVLYGLTRLIDIWGKTKWTFPFRVFGLNPLISYIMSGILVRLLLFVFKTEETTAYAWIYETIFQPTFGDHFGSLMFALSATLIIWLIAWVLWMKKIVIKV